MSRIENIKGFCERNRKWISIVAAAIVSLLFAGSILLAIFIGGELIPEAGADATKGMLVLNSAQYNKTYVEGDPFVFDKKESDISLIAKDTALDKVVKVDKLPDPEYGFMINGEGKIYYDPAEVIVTKDVQNVSIVSKQYPDIKLPLEVDVYASLDEAQLADSITMEAEAANLYDTKGGLLTEEQKKTLPNTEKPYLSNAGSTIAGTDCSGGACIRNFSKGMKMEFSFASAISGRMNLTIMACSRPSDTAFDSGVTMTVNGETIRTGATVPGASGYFTPYQFQVEIYVQRGLNTIVFEAIDSNCNMDALMLEAEEGTKAFGKAEALGELVNEKEPEEPEQPEDGAAEENPSTEPSKPEGEE